MKSLLLFSIMLLTACAGTVHPDSVRALEPGYAGNSTSGIDVKEIKPSGPIPVTSEWVTDYNKAIDDYGSDPYFKHALVHNEGVYQDPTGRYFASDEAHWNFSMMAGWRRSATHKPKSWLQKATGL